MFVYIQTYVFIILSLFYTKKLSKSLYKFSLFSIFVYFVIFIGLRHGVGSDWSSYIRRLHLASSQLFFELTNWDPAYVVLEYFSNIVGWGIYGVNIVCSAIFIMGLLYFIRSHKLGIPLTLLIAYPYLIMVVAMGYTRQSVALGLAFAMIGAVANYKTYKAVLLLVLAVLFHKTAIIMSVVLLRNKNTLTKLFVFALIPIIIIYMITIKGIYLENKINYYITGRLYSKGAVIRLLFNVLPITLLLMFRKRWKRYYNDFSFWLWMSLLQLLIFIFTIYTHSTTFGDRVSLYFYSIQIIIFVRVYHLIRTTYLKATYILLLIYIYTSVLLIWLFFSTHSYAWIPYDNILFQYLL